MLNRQNEHVTHTTHTDGYSKHRILRRYNKRRIQTLYKYTFKEYSTEYDTDKIINFHEHKYVRRPTRGRKERENILGRTEGKEKKKMRERENIIYKEKKV